MVWQAAQDIQGKTERLHLRTFIGLRTPCVYKEIPPKHIKKFQEKVVIKKVLGECLLPLSHQ